MEQSTDPKSRNACTSIHQGRGAKFCGEQRRVIASLKGVVGVCAVLGLIFPSSLFGATIRVQEKNRDAEAFISGEIASSDAGSFRDVMASVNSASTVEVYLDSKGGDVHAAIEIGRIIREQEASTIVGPNARCSSSCALIYISGVHRYNLGTIGLHRPYLSGQPRSRAVVETQAKIMFDDVKRYVSEMGVTERFFQELFNTEPAQIRLFVGDDILSLVPTDDPVFTEVETARDARRYGVTTSEMRERQRDANSCPQGKNYFTCYMARLWGLSEGVYRERASKAAGADQCYLTEAQGQTVDRLPRSERPDHPLVLTMLSCLRDIMQGR